MPYKRPMGDKDLFRPYEYVYDEYYDCIICPNNEVLKYTTTNRDGYRVFKSDPEKCAVCPYLHRCTKSKDHRKTVTKHIWSDYIELAEDYRHTPKYKAVYEMSKETIERVFAYAKERHSMRYTTLTGLAQVSKWGRLEFACMNRKKIAVYLRKGDNTCSHIRMVWKISVVLNRILIKITPVPEIGIGVI